MLLEEQSVRTVDVGKLGKSKSVNSGNILTLSASAALEAGC